MLHWNDEDVPASTLLVRNDECDHVVAVQDRAWPCPRKVLAERTGMRRRQNEWHNSFSPRPARQRRSAVRARDDLVVYGGSRELREIVTEFGVESLVVDNLTEADLELIGWSGSPLHVSHVAAELRRQSEETPSTSRP